ncbi:MAG: DUF5916 domain-containing protein [Daejeonella sp.]
MKKTVFFTFLTLSTAAFCLAQEVKKMSATRTDRSPKIDGLLNDDVWNKAIIATDFIELRPVPGRKEREDRRTEIRILYDNSAVYVAARMYDKPDSIARELVTRDKVGNSDFIGIVFDTYLDRINANGFYVTAAGSQYDAKYSQSGNEDGNWNAVWQSEVNIDSLGWTAEFKIPYSALRFGNRDVQTWGVNVTRRRQKINQQTFWNFVDPKVSGFINQEGELEGIEKIKAPVRLSCSPYISSFVNTYPYNQPGVQNTTANFNGGMDVKYGINQSFTLDLTLVPDFGQVQSDNQVLNLSPFEVKFDENRQFFTEGTELFNKGDLFYSRRIGSFPAYVKDVSGEINANEVIVNSPSESKLLNATKVSGRTSKGLGIGVFNAITNRMNATVQDDLGNKRFVEVQPLTNYSILVVDQSLKNNSSVTLLNTNVLRRGSAYDANVSAFLFNVNDKKNKYNIKGAAKLSSLSADGEGKGASNGFNYELKAGKQSGSFTWNFLQVLTDDQFDPTDLGFFNNNNFFDNSAYAAYSIYKPGKWYNQIETWINPVYSQRYKPRSYQSFGVYAGAYVQFKNFCSININLDAQSEGNDFYEARTAGRVFTVAPTRAASLSFNSNQAKKYNGGAYAAIRFRDQFNGLGLGYGFYQNYRVSNRFSFGTEVSLEPRFNYAGWLGTNSNSNEVIFSRYDRNTVESLADAKYTFSNKMGITIRGRHYWSDRRNKSFYVLTNEGGLQDNSGEGFLDRDRAYNVFNIDLLYSWQFAPGSELSVAYKDVSQMNEDKIYKGYGTNFNKIISAPHNNNLSLKILYYLDYLQLRKRS